MHIKSFLFAGSLIACTAYADSAPDPVVLKENKNPHHISYGLDFIAYQLDTHIKGVNVHGTRFFFGSGIGYEFLKPDAFYAGVDLFSATTMSDFNASRHEGNLFWHKADRIFTNFDLRFGYTFGPNRWMVSPFLGLGGYGTFAIDHHNDEGYEEAFFYFSGGLRTNYAFNETFNIGWNLEAFYSAAAVQEFKFKGGKVIEHHKAWGGKIAVPFKWYLGSRKRWDIQLEPYFTSLDFSGTQNIYGTRVIAGYRF